MDTNNLGLTIIIQLFRNKLFYYNMKRFEILKIFFDRSLSIKVTEQIVNPIILFAANFKTLKNKSK